MLKAKNNWAWSSSPPLTGQLALPILNEKRDSYTMDQLQEEGIFDIPGICLILPLLQKRIFPGYILLSRCSARVPNPI